jgi:predicted TIM-barrel fold metal-dependent hydrolase
MPDFPLIDSHVRLMDVEHLQFSWLTDRPDHNRSHTFDDLFKHMRD